MSLERTQYPVPYLDQWQENFPGQGNLDLVEKKIASDLYRVVVSIYFYNENIRIVYDHLLTYNILYVKEQRIKNPGRCNDQGPV